ncbi:MAG: virulence RhuM family protein [Candidatus Wildermuthbacteria bacterium]|nr:virulence RhuM family protein [Candidatus Wildermuthbacteria bacterium]
MKEKKQKQAIIIYKTKTGAIELRGDFVHDTIWATQAHIAEIFNIDRSVATKHIRNILKAKEINEKSNVQKMHIPNSDKPVAFYSLDMILAVGYRANSARAIIFRQWAPKTLRAHIVSGYTINKSRLEQNYSTFMKAMADVRALLPKSSSVDNEGILELISLFADTWFSLDAFDKEIFAAQGITKKKAVLTAQNLAESIRLLKANLMRKGEATELFAVERTPASIEGIVGNVMQAFGGKKCILP